MPHEVFERITADGIQAIGNAQVAAESLPSEGGRWGLSVVFRPKGSLRDELADLTAEAAAVIGQHHWRAGSHGAAHMTVRALEPHSRKPLDSKKLDRYVAAIRRSTQGIGSIPFEVQRLAVSPGTLMACAEDVVGAAEGRLAVDIAPEATYDVEICVDEVCAVETVTINLRHPGTGEIERGESPRPQGTLDGYMVVWAEEDRIDYYLPEADYNTSASITVRVMNSDGDVLADTEAPADVPLERSQPNGPGCPPVCFFGRMTV